MFKTILIYFVAAAGRYTICVCSIPKITSKSDIFPIPLFIEAWNGREVFINDEHKIWVELKKKLSQNMVGVTRYGVF